MTETLGLSRRERALVAGWERSRTKVVRLADLESVGPFAASIAKRLVEKKVLERIGRGLYLVRPFRASGQAWSFSSLPALEHLLAGTPHYVGGLSAFTLHRLTAQQHTSVVDVFVQSFRRSRRLGNARVVFHRRPAMVFKRGIIRLDLDGVAVQVADPERAAIDALDQFRVVGGMASALSLVRDAIPKLNTRKLVADALSIARTSTCQRLGLLLERAGKPGRVLSPLRERAEESRYTPLLIPGRSREGRLHPVWRVIENDGPKR